MFKIFVVFTFFLVGLAQCATVFDVANYGAKAGGTFKNTDAIAKAINAANAAGGGIVHFAKGTYLTGPINFKSNVNLQLDAGAVIKFSDDLHDYTPMAQVNSDGIKKMGFVSLISAEKVSNIAITGKGTLDGSGAKWWNLRKQWKSKHPGNQKPTNLDNVKTVEDLFDSSGNLINDISPPKFFFPHNSDHVTLDSVSFINSPFITIVPTFTDYITINSINVNNPHDAPNTDGIDPSSCRHVTISYCTVSVGDDCLAIKTATASGVAKPSENITVHDCIMYSGHGGFVIGSTTQGGVNDVTVYNMHFEGTDRGIRIKTEKGHGGVVQNIHIRNVTMKGITAEGITINALYAGTHEPNPGVGAVPVISDIYIQDVTGDAKLGIDIEGLPEKHFSNIQLKNVHIVTNQPITISNAEVIQTNVTVSSH